MKIYLVGGAVRDALLGLPITERDWVVVGATPEEMLNLGYQPVGKDFPVFLHPITHEEYALARTERKTGKGYKGFAFHSAPNVSLAEDLQRRDLTINAIAQTAEGQLIDPYEGQTDLKNRILRHVSPAFQEDPVRILRVARFAARFTDFSIHPDTYELMRFMVENGEVEALVAERVWQEFSRALEAKNPQLFLTVLEKCGALAVLFPEIKLTTSTITALANAIKISPLGPVRLAALLYELDKQAISNLCNRYRLPREYSDLALLMNRCLSSYQQIKSNTSANDVFSLLKILDARRRPERFQQFLLAADTVSNPNPVAKNFLEFCLQEIQLIDIQPLLLQGLKGHEFAQALENLQLATIRHIQKQFFTPA